MLMAFLNTAKASHPHCTHPPMMASPAGQMCQTFCMLWWSQTPFQITRTREIFGLAYMHMCEDWLEHAGLR